jgi:Fic family protein
MHVPLNRDAVSDAMPAFFDLLREEPHPAVRVVLGHFIFVYIHPYMDGKRPRRALPDEHDDVVGRIPVNGHTRQ